MFVLARVAVSSELKYVERYCKSIGVCTMTEKGIAGFAWVSMQRGLLRSIRPLGQAHR